MTLVQSSQTVVVMHGTEFLAANSSIIKLILALSSIWNNAAGKHRKTIFIAPHLNSPKATSSGALSKVRLLFQSVALLGCHCWPLNNVRVWHCKHHERRHWRCLYGVLCSMGNTYNDCIAPKPAHTYNISIVTGSWKQQWRDFSHTNWQWW